MEKLRLVVRNARTETNELNTEFHCSECKNSDRCRNTKTCYLMVYELIPSLKVELREMFHDYISYGYDRPSDTITFYAEVGRKHSNTKKVMKIINNALTRYKKAIKKRGSR